MSKSVKLLACAVVVSLLCGSVLAFAACEEEDKRVSITIKISCREVVNGELTGPVVGTWIFTPDIDTMHIEREYDGKEYNFYVAGYMLPPEVPGEGEWKEPEDVWRDNIFLYDATMIESLSTKTDVALSVCERENYVYSLWNFYYDSSKTWLPREIELYIDVV